MLLNCKILKIVFIFVVFADLASGQNVNECRKKLRICTNITRLPDFIRNATSAAELDLYCGYYNQTEACIANSGCSCADDVCSGYLFFSSNLTDVYDKYLYWTFYARDALGFICNEGRKAFLNYQRCFVSQYYLPLQSVCFQKNSTSNIAWEACRQRNIEVKCLSETADVKCESSQFVLDYYKKLISNQLNDLYNCKLDYVHWNFYNNYSYCDTSTTCVNSYLKTALIFVDATKFNETCKGIESAHKCMVDVARCNDSDDDALPRFARWKGTKHAWSYVCNKLPPNYDRSCALKTINETMQLCSTPISGDYCQAYRKRIDCLAEQESKRCGGNSIYTRNFFTELFKPTLKAFFKCDLVPILNATTSVTPSNGKVSSTPFKVLNTTKCPTHTNGKVSNSPFQELTLLILAITILVH